MATGDKRLVVRADGFSADLYVEGFAVGSTIDYGYSVESITVSAGTANRPTPTANTPSVTVTDLGFDSSGNATTVERTAYLTGSIRKPYPDEADLDEEVISGEWRIRVALSEEIYAKANTGAGNSGTACTFSAIAGTVTNSADAAESNAAVAVSTTNSSTLAYPKVIGQWSHDITPLWERRGSDFEIAFRPRHGIRNVACVRFNAVGETSAAEGSGVTVSTRSLTQSTVTGLYHDPYVTTVDVSVFDQGEQIILRARAYPVIGDADSVLDTEDRTASIEQAQRGDARVYATCNKTGVLTQYAVIDPVGGDDPTGVVSGTLATAEASPYATIKAAAADGATVIYLLEGTHAFLGNTVITLAHAIEVGPLPGETAANCVVDAAGTDPSTRLFQWDHVRFFGGITIDASSSFWDWQDVSRTVKFDGVICSGTNSNAPMHYRVAVAMYVNCTISGWRMAGFSTTQTCFSAIGCRLNSMPLVMTSFGSIVACDQGDTGNISMEEYQDTVTTLDLRENIMIEFNNFDRRSTGVSQRFINWGSEGSSGRLSVVGNVFVSTGTSVLYFWGDGNFEPCSNFIFAHNTAAGVEANRSNAMYNDEGSVSTARNLLFWKANAMPLVAVKADVFLHPEDGRNGNRIGNWPFVFGANCLYNCEDNVLFPREILGVGSVILGTAYGDQGYTDDNSPATDSTLQGDYTPTASSPLKDVVPREFALIDFDLFGKRLPSTADIGGVQRGSVVDGTGQVEADGTIRMNFTRLSGLWGSTITPDNTKITAISQVTGGTRTFSVGSVSGAGSGTLQVIITPSPLIYSTASGGVVTVTIAEGWLADENGNTTAAFSGIDDVDNSSTQTPPSTTLFLTRGRGGGSVSSKTTVRVINR